jgi:CTP synthase (UTP-ammonia lyase)
MRGLLVALVGDYDPTVTAHVAIPKALAIAGGANDVDVTGEWIGTDTLSGIAAQRLAPFDAIWCVPASPYASMAGALDSIQFARESQLPFLGTCGGYQHAVLEFAQNVLGLGEADNAEVNPGTTLPLIAAMSCALVEQTGAIRFLADSLLHTLHGVDEVVEGYHCSYGVNPQYLPLFDATDLRFTGFDTDGEPRCFELRHHPFFLGTAYQPERWALRGDGHPLIDAFVKAAATRLRRCA